METETGRKIKCLQSDGGKEYFSVQFNSYLQQMGIRLAQVLLGRGSLPKFYWAEAVKIAVSIQNRIGHKVSAHELYFGMKPNLRHLRVFSSIAYVHVPKEKRKKLDAKAKKCILVSYSDEQKGYKSYNPTTKQVRVSGDVVFDESVS